MSTRIGLFLGYGAGVVLAGALFAGCGGISPGDYKVYRIAVTESELSTGCYPNKTVPYDVRSDSSTFRGSATFILYASAEDKFYLDVGKATFEGTAADDVYNFEGKTVDVNYTGPDGTGDKQTSTVTTTIAMTVDGAMVTGKQTTKTSYKCSGSTCGQPIPSCTETIEFVGTEVEDVQLDYAVEEGSGSGSSDVSGPTGGPTGGPSGSSGDPSGSTGDPGGTGGASSSSSASGTGGSVGSCNTCSDLLEGTTVPSDPVCESSSTVESNILSCACSSACASACSTSMCGGLMPDSNCQSCMVEACNTEYSACQDDF